jgi:hypothetical protein
VKKVFYGVYIDSYALLLQKNESFDLLPFWVLFHEYLWIRKKHQMTTRASGSNQQIQYNYDNGNSINHNYGINKALTNQLCNIVTHKTTCFKNFHQFLQDLLQLSHDRGVPTETIKSSNKNKE